MLTHPPILRRASRAALVASASMLLALAATANPAHAPSGYNILYTFQGTPDGAYPSGQQVRANGNIYGVTLVGGANSDGQVYEMSPGKHGSWTKQSIYDFRASWGPSGNLIADGSGNLWGTTFGGGANNGGVLFELSPPSQQGQLWTLTDAYDFPRWATLAGSGPSAIVFDTLGDVFGLYEFGSPYVGCEQNGCGKLYELTPPVGGSGPWTETDLYTFTTTNGHNDIPYTLTRKGNALYGITTDGGSVGEGSVWQARYNSRSSNWKVSDVHDFCTALDGYGDCTDGSNPTGGVVFDGLGNMYGTTFYGGPGIQYNTGSGTVFQLMPPQSKGTAWGYTLLRVYYPGFSTDQNGVLDGWSPGQTLTLDKSGNVYGTTSVGGYIDAEPATGTIFELAAGTWAETNLHIFGAGNQGTDLRTPTSPLTRDSRGNLYGTTQWGASNEYGGAFELTP